jgi:tetratricopeptide (TPR) repeat protein
MNSALEQFGYPRDAILSPPLALTLAKNIPGTKGVVTSTLTRRDGRFELSSRLFPTQVDAGVLHRVEQQPGEKLDAFGARAADDLKPALLAFDDAKACEDQRETKPADARKAAEKALKAAPDDALAHLCLAQLALKENAPREKVVEHLTAATRGDPQSLTAWALLADQRAAANDTAGVVAAYQQMLLIAPENQKLTEQAFKYMLQAGKPDAAVQVADEGLKRDPFNWNLYDLKSNACLFLSNFPCAIDALEAAYQVDSTRADSLFFRKIAVAAAQQPDTVRLNKWASRGIARYPNNVELLGYANQAFALTGKSDSAIMVTRKLIELDPTQVGPALAATQSLAGAGRVAEAKPFIDMIQQKGSPQEKEQLAAIFANAALPLIQKQPADFNGAADLSRQCVASADPKGRVVGSCHLILGIAAFQSAVAMDGETEKNKSCDMARKEAELVAEAKGSLTTAGASRPDAVKQYLDAIPQFEKRTQSMIAAYCK